MVLYTRRSLPTRRSWTSPTRTLEGGDDTVGNSRRAQIFKFELFELFEIILLLKLGKQLPVERFEATVSQSTVPSPPLRTYTIL